MNHMKSLMAAALGIVLLAGGGVGGDARAEDLAGRWENGPQGVYFMQVYQVVARSLERRVYVFRGNRWMQDPEGTIEQVDIESMRPAWRGSWAFDGTNFTLAPDSGAPDVEAITPDAQGCFQFVNGIWCPAIPFSTGIDGRYSGGTSYNTLSTAADYDFSPDGTYSALKTSSYNNPDGGDASRTGADGRVTGTYRIEGFTMILTESSGAEVRGTAFPAFGNTGTTRPDYIYFGGIMMPRTGD